MSDSLEFRAPFTLFGGEKKLKVFEKFTQHLTDELTSDRQHATVIAYKDTYRPILSSLWLIQLLIYVERLEDMIKKIEGPLSEEDYRAGTWNMFDQFQQFWTSFNQKKRMLVHTEGDNEKLFQNIVVEKMRKCMQKEVEQGSFNTCHALIRLLFNYEQEYFNMKSDNKLDMLSQLVRICRMLSEHSPNYKEDFYNKIEQDPNYESILFAMISGVQRDFRDTDKRFETHLSEILKRFRAIERRILLLRVAEKSNSDLLYRGFCEYEQLKIFMENDLDYITEFFERPFTKYKKLLSDL